MLFGLYESNYLAQGFTASVVYQFDFLYAVTERLANCKFLMKTADESESVPLYEMELKNINCVGPLVIGT